MIALCVVAVLLAVSLWLPRAGLLAEAPVRAPQPAAGGAPRLRLPAAGLAAAGVALLVPPPLGWVASAGAAAAAWWWITAAESTEVVRRRAEVAQQLPDVVRLLAMALRTGIPLEDAVDQIARARPGSAAQALTPVAHRLRMGLSGAEAWHGVRDDPSLARLGRAVSRSAESGAPIAAVVARLADQLAVERAVRATDRAHTVGVRAAVPLGLCLLPAFLLLGIVPVVAASISELAW